MFRSVVPGIKNLLFAVAIMIALTLNYSFKYSMNSQDWLIWTNHCLSQAYDPSADTKLKKWDFLVTGDSFIRLRKTYAKGKQEYFSFNLHNFNDMDYIGNTNVGTLELKTMADDIIVQTYNDRKGDVDSMTTVLNIPVRNMEPERLDSLRMAFNYFKTKGL
ncbi:hypothetical protein [Mucilaginibacter sp.]|uniref:hypothetical protein n=1 Tax=Mucilaginibacter sp. TaxID=1882438 RepID=UPI003D1526F1